MIMDKYLNRLTYHIRVEEKGSNMDIEIVNKKTILKFAGTFIAFLAGAGFATGQEILQYFASYGYMGIVGAFVVLVILLYVGTSFITVGQEQKFERGSDIFKYYCGNILGTLLDYFSIIFIYSSFIIMIAGAGATFHQHFGFPIYIGCIVMTCLACITVLFGLGNIVEVIGKIGPIIVIISIIVGIISIFTNLQGLLKVNNVLTNINITKASTNWFFAATSYVGFCMLWLAGFLASMGATANNKKEAYYGGAIGAIGFSAAIIIVTLGLLSCIEDVAGSQIPLLILAEKIHPLLGIVFSLIIVLGIYNSSVPLLWSVSSRFAKDKSDKFRALTIALAIVALLIGTRISFAKLINVLYVVNGYVGMVLLIIMIIKSVNKKVLN